jgi:hypothetical protein
MVQLKSRSELMQHVACRAPSRPRDDDRTVELFLSAFRQGRFATNPLWLPQHVGNVEVIATDQNGRRLAIEHTRVFAFEQQREQELLLQPIVECLEAVELPGQSDKYFQLHFQTNFMGRTLRKYRSIVLQELPRWAARELPRLKPRDNFVHALSIPIELPGSKKVGIDVEVEVWENVPVARKIHVDGVLPSGNRLEPEMRRALSEKLPKLVRADAHERFLMIEQPRSTDSDNALLEIIRNVAAEFPLLPEIHGIVFAKTYLLHEKLAYFNIWDVQTRQWSEHLKASIAEATTGG